MNPRPIRLATLVTALAFGIVLEPALVPDVQAQNPVGVLSGEQNLVEMCRQVSPAVVSVRHRRGAGSGGIIRADGVLRTTSPGTTVTLVVHRDGQETTVNVRLTEAPAG